VLCNGGDANPTQYARAVAEAYLGRTLSAPPAPAGGRGGRGGAPPASAFQPSETDLRSYAGRYASDEAETILNVALEGRELVVKRRPDTTLRMRAVSKDVFAVPSLGELTFHRGPSGQISELGLKLDRVWDLRFQRLP
jgi:hypothetical protein